VLVEWRKLDHSIVIAPISQWHRRVGAYELSVRAQD